MPRHGHRVQSQQRQRLARLQTAQRSVQDGQFSIHRDALHGQFALTVHTLAQTVNMRVQHLACDHHFTSHRRSRIGRIGPAHRRQDRIVAEG